MAIARPTVVYSAEYRSNTLEQILRLVAFRELFYGFIEREIRSRYKQTLLWAAWAIVPPVVQMVVFSVFLGRFSKLSSEGFPYPIFVYTALLPWSFFASALSSATVNVVTNRQLVTKVAFPREILPWGTFIGAGIDFLAATLVLAGLLVFYRVDVSPTVLFVIPLLGIQLVFMAGLGLLFAMLFVYLRDLRFIVPFAMNIWMMATPVVYSAENVPERLRGLYLGLNPMAVLVQAYREVILKGTMPDLPRIGVVAIAMLVFLMLSYTLFKRVERNFADVI